MALWRPARPSRTHTQKRWPFHYRGLNAKVGSQEIPGVTGKFGHGVQNEAGQRLTEICQENALIITNTSSNNTRKDSTYGHCQRVNMKSDWLYSLQPKMEKLHTVSKNKTGSWLWLRSWNKFILKLKKVGKTTKPFMYGLNQIPYNYTV